MGESQSPLPHYMRWAGPLLASGYGMGTRLHRALTKPRSAPIPTICVGNLTAGGTGKTPAVSYFARGLSSRGKRPAVLIRGYKGQVNDEAQEFQAALSILKIPLFIGAERRSSAITAASQGCDVAVLDDGFQHWALARDLDIVLIDATDPFGGGQLLPYGRLRERPQALSRAGIIVITRADAVPKEKLAELDQTIRQHAPSALLATAVHQPLQLHNLDGQIHSLERFKNLNVIALSGIGSPAGFKHTLSQLGANVLHEAIYPDHHLYTQQDLSQLMAMKADRKCEIVCTEKDAAKLAALSAQGILALKIEFSFLNGETAVWDRIELAIKSAERRCSGGVA